MQHSRPSATHPLLAAALLLSACATDGSAQLETPDGTVRYVLTGLQNQNPRVLWDALPRSYQRDVTALIHESATVMDRDIHQAGFATLGKVVTVLRDQRDFILSQPLIAGATDRGEAEQRWSSVVGMFDVFAHSELADLDKVRTLDVGGFLGGTGAQVMRHMTEVSALAPDDPMARFKEVSVELVSHNGDHAVVRLTGPDVPASHNEPILLTRVEGRWVPADLAAKWQSQMADARKSLAAMSEEQRRRDKPQVLAMLAAVSSVADQMAAAATQEEFNRAAEGALPIVFGMMMMGAMLQQGN
jgi:hypothetical protein